MQSAFPFKYMCAGNDKRKHFTFILPTLTCQKKKNKQKTDSKTYRATIRLMAKYRKSFFQTTTLNVISQIFLLL